ncbi:MAG: hypothetical protein JOZ99_09555 [Actinobacteria bacterium]|nr:hypothetical protein [Actinomycetota bacterium]
MTIAPQPVARRLVLLVAPVVAVACAGSSSPDHARAGPPSHLAASVSTTTTPPTTLPRALPVTTTPPPTAEPVLPGRAPVATPGVFALGDSVMLGAAPQLRAKGFGVDAVESRQWTAGTAILRLLAAAGRLPRVVVVHLGTNGPVTSSQLDDMMRVLAGHRVILLTAHEPRSWQAEVNNTLRAGVARWPGSVLVDWDAAGNAHPEWFRSDRIHLRPAGAQAYADLVANCRALTRRVHAHGPDREDNAHAERQPIRS